MHRFFARTAFAIFVVTALAACGRKRAALAHDAPASPSTSP